MKRRLAFFDPRRVLSTRHVRWGEVDWHVLGVALCLLAFGLVFLQAMAGSLSSLTKDPIRFEAHLEKVALTLPLVAVGMLLRPSWLRHNAHLLYGACILLLLLVPFVGEERNNARRWIPLPFFDLQPSELAKVGVILMLARSLVAKRLQRIEDWVQPAAIVLLPMALVALQPDLGTALTLVPVTLGLLYAAGARGGVLLALCACGVFVGTAAVRGELVHGYQLKRIETWRDSFDHEALVAQRNRAGFHVYHARTAIGNGGLFGRGLGEGVANETGILPERDSDSIFAVIAEEAGWTGTTALLLLYLLLVVLLLLRAARLRDRFARLVVVGVALYFASHAFINASVNLGLLPMTGLTLPLFSTGGSSLLATFLALGVALGLSSHHEPSFGRDW